MRVPGTILFAAVLTVLSPRPLQSQDTTRLPSCCDIPWDAVVRALAGDTVVLDRGDQYGVGYRAVRYERLLGSIGFHVLDVGLYEGGHYVLVDPRLRSQTYLDRIPVVSPDGTRIATAAESIGGMWGAHLIQIFQVHQDHVSLEWECVTLSHPPGRRPPAWGARNPEWVNDSTLQVTRVDPLDFQAKDAGTVMIRRGLDGWSIEDAWCGKNQ